MIIITTDASWRSRRQRQPLLRLLLCRPSAVVRRGCDRKSLRQRPNYIAFDAATKRNDVVRDRRLADQEPPDHKAGEHNDGQNQNQNQANYFGQSSILHSLLLIV